MQVMFKPLGDRVVVEPGPEEEVSSGGIVLPDTAKKKPQEGKVLAVGPGRLLENGKRVPVAVKEGDTVIYSKYGGTEIKVKGKDYVILSEDDVLAVK
jgi:chaperonin GroES